MSELSLPELKALVAQGGLKLKTDSRKTLPNDVFIAVPGVNDDGAKYLTAAKEQGATYFVLSEEAFNSCSFKAEPKLCFCICSDVRKTLAELAAACYHTHEHNLKILGITGTNGKTTTTYLLEHLLSALGEKVGVLGTVSYRYPGFVQNAPLTTPDPISLHAFLQKMSEASCTYALMEISSHALAQDRVHGLNFTGAAFTNLTQDHLDYHSDMESYFLAKAKLFLELPIAKKSSAINCDDPYGERLLQLCPWALAYGASQSKHPRQLLGEILSQSPAGLKMRFTYQGKTWELNSPLVGAFNFANLMTAQALALELGIAPADFKKLESFSGVKGRLERVNVPGKHIFVDYAHTPDALVNVLTALRKAGFARIIAVFGCGGNRDSKKRPLMGEAVAKYADVAVVTSDNPRNEEPEAIIKDILPGLKNAPEVHLEPNRKEATKLGLSLLKGPHDCLLIAGKGHEDYQIIQGVRHHYSDQEVVQELCSASLFA